MSEQRRVCIAGAGLMGSLLAWRLARQGFQVEVYEAAAEDQPASAAHTAAAMVAPYSERSLAHPEVFALGLQSLQLWPQLLPELHADSGIAVHYGQSGSLVVAHPADQAELTQFAQGLRQVGLWNPADDGCENEAAIQRLNQARLQNLEPALNPQLAEGFWLRHEAWVDHRALLPALHKAARSFGARFYFATPLNDFPPYADIKLDCRGLGAKPALPQLRGVRGEVLWIESQEVQISRPIRLLHPRYHLYLVPKGRHRYVLGATEIESEDRSPVSVRSALEMLSALYCLSSALAEARILNFDVNLRPALADHRPQILAQDDGVLSINGLFRHGYLLAPALLQRLQQQHGLALGLEPAPTGQYAPSKLTPSQAIAFGGEACA